jgi:hypothetical protein
MWLSFSSQSRPNPAALGGRGDEAGFPGGASRDSARAVESGNFQSRDAISQQLSTNTIRVDLSAAK